MHIGTLLLLLASAATLTQKQTATVKKVEASLMAPCCYSQTIDQHMSDAAEQMRFEVADMVASGSSEQEILDHYKAIYGERILAVPDGVIGQLAFAIPMVVFAGSCAFLALVLRRFRMAQGYRRRRRRRTGSPRNGWRFCKEFELNSKLSVAGECSQGSPVWRDYSPGLNAVHNERQIDRALGKRCSCRLWSCPPLVFRENPPRNP
jgi:cytochrome c-type biogenesis protein CcmH/NrfF